MAKKAGVVKAAENLVLLTRTGKITLRADKGNGIIGIFGSKGLSHTLPAAQLRNQVNADQHFTGHGSAIAQWIRKIFG